MHISNIKSKEILNGFHGRFVHMEGYTIAFWDVKAGSELPMHSHMHEQTTQVTEGKFEMTCANETKVWESGMLLKIPSNMLHGGRALTDCKITDIFSPAREDYKF